MTRRPLKGRGLTRRLLLRGAGGVAIGLPLLPELMPRARGDEDDGIPYRMFTMTFGLGISADMQAEQFDGPLQPLQPFASKAALFTNVDGLPLEAGGVPHYRIAASTFTGVPQNPSPSYTANGPSMDQVMKRALHPNGVPNVAVPELSVGIWSRTGCVSQFTRQWNDDGSPGMRPLRRPTDVFSTLFGGYVPTDPDGSIDPALVAERHLHRSVLDTVMEQYTDLTGPNSKLGADSKARIDNHLAALRDVEQQLAPTEDVLPMPVDCTIPSADDISDPEPYTFYDADIGAAGSGSPLIDWQVADQAMQLVGQLMALGAACDAVRFGSLVSVGAGDYVRFQGQYSAIGGTADFSTLLATSPAHDAIFHAWNPDAVRQHQHMSISMLAHMLAAMDNVVEANGKTLLDNSVVLLGTEYSTNHDASHVFHAVLGGGGRFNPGWYDFPVIPSDIYHQTLAAYGIDSGIPDRWTWDQADMPGFRNE